jgi:hypothetical protein
MRLTWSGGYTRRVGGAFASAVGSAAGAGEVAGASGVGVRGTGSRVYLVDVLACPCGGRRAIVADLSEREVVVAILAHLELPTEAPPLARARSPGFDFT